MPEAKGEGRLLNSLLYGLPIDSGLTREEQILRTLTRGLSDIRSRLLPAGSQPTALTTQSVSPQPAPVIDVHVPDQSEFLAPRVDELIREQRQAVDGISEVAWQSSQSVAFQRRIDEELDRQTDLAHTAQLQRSIGICQGNLEVMYLRSLNDSGRKAFLQRREALNELRSVRDVL